MVDEDGLRRRRRRRSVCFGQTTQCTRLTGWLADCGCGSVCMRETTTEANNNNTDKNNNNYNSRKWNGYKKQRNNEKSRKKTIIVDRNWAPCRSVVERILPAIRRHWVIFMTTFLFRIISARHNSRANDGQLLLLATTETRLGAYFYGNFSTRLSFIRDKRFYRLLTCQCTHQSDGIGGRFIVTIYR